MTENLSEEKLRVIDIIKENATTAIVIGGFVWAIYTTIILPIKNLEYQTGDIINNHIKTIQDEQVTASAERASQTIQLNELQNSITRLNTLLEQGGEAVVK